MPELLRSILRKFGRPASAVRSLQLRAEMGWLHLQNRFSARSVATGGSGTVVSLTTYGSRTRLVYLTIESIARGEMQPSRLILWLDDAVLYANLPEPLQRLKRRGVEILFCKNYGPHKKYYPYVEGEKAFSDPLVTADDDVIYPSSWLAGLVAAHQRFPGCVNGYRARVMLFRDGKAAPYRDWPLCESADPSYRTVATGVSGVIYPTGLLERLKAAGTGFEACCPRADDLWLHVHAIRAGFPIRQIQPKSILFPLIPGSQVTALWAENLEHDDGNDRQLALTYQSSDMELLKNQAEAVQV